MMDLKETAVKLLVSSAIVFSSTVLSEERVETIDGRHLLLYSDGTYEEMKKVDKKEEDEKYKKIDITDLKIDIDSLGGDLIKVDTSLMMMGDTYMLSSPNTMTDTNPVMAEDGGITREEKKFVLNNCGMGCKVTVRGEVSESFMGSTIEIHSIEN